MDNLGDCYEVSGRYMINHPNTKMILVHAEVIGQGQLEGIPYGHAFLLDRETDMIHDYSNGRKLKMPRMVYYLLGKVEEEVIWTPKGRKERTPKIYYYSWEEVMNKMSEYGTFGPWDLETENGY